MISTTRTIYSEPHPNKPAWVLSEPEDGSFGALFVGLGGIVGTAAGAFLCCIVDVIWVNGAGMAAGSTAATFSQLWPYLFAPAIIGMVGTFLAMFVLPRRYKPTYFTSRVHQEMHAQFMSLSPTSRTFAQEAYDAVAGFGEVDFASAEYELEREAQRIWSRTYEELRSRDKSGPTELHEERIEAARKALETLK